MPSTARWPGRPAGWSISRPIRARRFPPSAGPCSPGCRSRRISPSFAFSLPRVPSLTDAVYNRYAHYSFVLPPSPSVLVQGDVFAVGISPCSARLLALWVNHFLVNPAAALPRECASDFTVSEAGDLRLWSRRSPVCRFGVARGAFASALGFDYSCGNRTEHASSPVSSASPSRCLPTRREAGRWHWIRAWWTRSNAPARPRARSMPMSWFTPSVAPRPSAGAAISIPGARSGGFSEAAARERDREQPMRALVIIPALNEERNLVERGAQPAAGPRDATLPDGTSA